MSLWLIVSDGLSDAIQCGQMQYVQALDSEQVYVMGGRLVKEEVHLWRSRSGDLHKSVYHMWVDKCSN